MQCSRADSGTYTCDTGEMNTSCTLEVYGESPPEGYRTRPRLHLQAGVSHLTEHQLEIVQELEDLYIQEEQNAVFMCEVSLDEVVGEWYKDGHKIRPSSTTKIRSEGQRTSRVKLLVKADLLITVKMMDSKMSGTLSGTKHFLLMCSVKAEDAGEVRFTARDVESVAYLEVEGRSDVTSEKDLQSPVRFDGSAPCLRAARFYRKAPARSDGSGEASSHPGMHGFFCSLLRHLVQGWEGGGSLRAGGDPGRWLLAEAGHPGGGCRG